MKPKLTPWIDGSVKPVRIGVYQRRIYGFNSDGNYAYWNGEFWAAFVGCKDSPERAVVVKDTRSLYYGIPWRGLASDPSKAEK